MNKVHSLLRQWKYELRKYQEHIGLHPERTILHVKMEELEKHISQLEQALKEDKT